MTTLFEPVIGTELAGYRIEALLGRGGMSVVFLAQDLALDRRVALKLLAPELAEDERFRERFRRESRLAASIDHPAIVPIYEAGEVDGQLYIAMRYVEGTDLKALLRSELRLGPERALAVVSQVADALDEAHERGLVHRDVKPSNVLIDGRERCYLADFGLTKRTDDRTDLTGSEQLVGTCDYVAPEVVQGAVVDRRADLYSLGCLFYECLCGEVPYRRDSELAVLWAHVHDSPPRTGMDPPLDAVIARALAKDPASRYPTGRALVEAAREALPRPESGSRKRARLIFLAAAIGAAVALASVLALVFRESATAPDTTPTLTPAGHAVQRIDPDTNELVATLRVPVAELGLVVGGGSVWAASVDQNRVFEIDADQNRVAGTIDGVGHVASIGFGADSLWVLNARDGVVSQIDPDTREVVGTAALPPGAWSVNAQLRAGKDGVWLSWVTEEGNAVRVDPNSLAAKAVQIGTSTLAHMWDFAPVAAGRLYILGDDPREPFQGAVLVADPRRSTLADADVVVLPTTYGETIVGTPNGAWVTDPVGDRVLFVDGRTRRVGRRIEVGTDPLGIAAGAGAVWTANGADGTVTRIDPRTGRVTATIPVGPNPQEVVVGEGGVWVDVHPT